MKICKQLPYEYGPLFALVAQDESGKVVEIEIRFPDEVPTLLVGAQVLKESGKAAHVMLHAGEFFDGAGNLTFWVDGKYTPLVESTLELFDNPKPESDLKTFLEALATASILAGPWYDPWDEFTTVDLFWDCQCRERFIHPFLEDHCQVCDQLRDEAPSSRDREILAHADEWELDRHLVGIVKVMKDFTQVADGFKE